MQPSVSIAAVLYPMAPYMPIPTTLPRPDQRPPKLALPSRRASQFLMNWLKVSLELPEEIKISERADPAMAALYELPIPAESSRSAAKLLKSSF
jgi:hypothetical protein